VIAENDLADKWSPMVIASPNLKAHGLHHRNDELEMYGNLMEL